MIANAGPLKSKKSLKIIFSLCVFLLLGLIYQAYGVAFHHFVIFIFLLFLLVVFPGSAIFDWLKIKTSALQAVSLILTLGFVSTIFLTKFSRWFKIEFFLFLWSAFCTFWFFRFPHRRSNSLSPSNFNKSFVAGISAVFLAFLFILLIDNFSNGRIMPSGDIALRMRFYDGFLRIAIIHELSHSFPPQLPIAAGHPLGYHFGMDLFFSLFSRYGHLDIFDISHRLGLTFLAFLFFLNLILLLKTLLKDNRAIVFGSIYLLFGSGGLAYIFSWLFRAPFTGNIFFNFYFHQLISLNSFLPCLAILFASLTAISHYEEKSEKGWLIAAGISLAALFEFKVFMIIPVAGSLFLTSLIQLILSGNKNALRLSILTALFSLPLFLYAITYSQQAMSYRFILKPVDWISHVLRELHLTHWQKSWSMLISANPQGFSALLIGSAAIGIFLLGTFGLNLLALPQAIKSILDSSILKNFLSWFFLISMANFFLLNLYLGKLARNILNIYVFNAGLVCLSIFFLLMLDKKLVHRKPKQKVILLILLGFLTLPNTIIYLTSRIKQPEIRFYSKYFLEAATWVRKNTPPEAIFIHPSDMRYICYFAGRRVVLDNSIHSYVDFHLPRPKIRERLADIDRFFHNMEKNVDVLFKYNVNYIWINKLRSLSSDELNQNSSRDIVLSSPPTSLNPSFRIQLKAVFVNQEHLIYEVKIIT